MTFIFSNSIWEILQITPNAILTKTNSLIFLGMFVFVLIEKELIRINTKEDYDEEKTIFNVYIVFMLILLLYIVATNFLPFLFNLE